MKPTYTSAEMNMITEALEEHCITFGPDSKFFDVDTYNELCQLQQKTRDHRDELLREGK